MRLRAARIVAVLPNALPPGTRVTQLDLQGTRAKIEGEAVSTSRPNDLALSLATALPGWQIMPPIKRPHAHGTLCWFTIELADVTSTEEPQE
jgi:hypothetical protein